jgi:hypothetical protein
MGFENFHTSKNGPRWNESPAHLQETLAAWSGPTAVTARIEKNERRGEFIIFRS